eukprot:gene5824-7248_t
MNIVVVESARLEPVHGEPTCRGLNNESVSWWFIYRINKNKDNYIYLDSKQETLISSIGLSKKLSDATSPFYYTYSQVDYNDLGYTIYNDQPLDKNAGNFLNRKINQKENYEPGHSKGMIIWNPTTGGGIHIAHSLPKFPKIYSTDPNMWPTVLVANPLSFVENQHFFCYYYHDVSLFSTYMARNNVVFHPLPPVDKNGNVIETTFTRSSTEIPLNLKVNFNEYMLNKDNKRQTIMDDILTDCKKGDIKNCYGQFEVDLLDIGKSTIFYKTSFRFFDGSKPTVKDVTVGENAIIYPTGDNESIGFSRFKSIPSNVADVFSYNYQEMMNTENFQFSNTQNSNYDMTQQKNHAKIATLMTPDPNNEEMNLFCVGDSNRGGRQQIRGGGIICFQNKILASAFSKAPAFLAYIDPKGDDTTQLEIPYTFYTKTTATIKYMNLDGDKVLAPHKTIVEVVDRLYLNDMDPLPIAFSRAPRKLIPADPNGVVEFFHNSVRNHAVPNTIEPTNFPSKSIHQDTLVNLDYLLQDELTFFCASDKDCQSKISMKCKMTPKYIDPNAMVEFPEYENGVLVEKYDKNVRFKSLEIEFSVDYDNCPLLQAKNIMGAIWKELDKDDTFPIEPLTIMYDEFESMRPSYIDFHYTKPKIVLNGRDRDCVDVHSFLVIQYYLFRDFKRQYIPTGHNFELATLVTISRMLLNKVTKREDTTFKSFSLNQNCFVEFLDLHPEVYNGFDFEKTDYTQFNKIVHQYIGTLWDWIDVTDDREFGYKPSTYQDSNSPRPVKIKDLAKALPETPILNWDTIIYVGEKLAPNLMTASGSLFYRAYIRSILWYNGFEPKDDQQSSNSKLMMVFKNNEDDKYDVLKNQLIEIGRFSNEIVNRLSVNQMDLILESLDQWMAIRESVSTALHVLIIDSKIPNPIFGIQAISYLDDLEKLKSPKFTSNIGLCYSNSIHSVCNPMSLHHLTHSILNQIEDHSFNPIVIGDLIIYFIPKPRNLNLPFDGLSIATINSKLCDIQLSTLSEFKNRSILDRICLRSGPIIGSVVYNEIDKKVLIQGAHFYSTDYIVIGGDICPLNQSSHNENFNGTQLECTAEFITGSNQLIEIHPRISIYRSQFKFNQNKPIIKNVLFSGYLNQSTPLEQRLTIKGDNFGIKQEDISIRIGSPSGNSFIPTIISVSNSLIECKFTENIWSFMRLITIDVKNQYITYDYELNRYWNWGPSLNTTQYYPGELMDISKLSGFSPISESYIIGDKICPLVNESHCQLPQNIGLHSIVIQNQYTSAESGPYTFQYGYPIMTNITNSIIQRGQYFSIHGKGLGLDENLDSLSIGPVDIKDSCEVLNHWITCKIPNSFEPVFEAPVMIRVGGTVVTHQQMNSPNITVLASEIAAIDNVNQVRKPTQIEINISGTFPLPNGQVTIGFSNGGQMISPITCTISQCQFIITQYLPEFQHTVRSISISFLNGRMKTNTFTIVVPFNFIGSVFYDQYINHILDPTEPLLPNIVLVLTNQINTNQRFESTTDSYGQFNFTSIPDGNYFLKFKDIIEGNKLMITVGGNQVKTITTISSLEIKSSNHQDQNRVYKYSMPVQPISTKTFCNVRVYASSNNFSIVHLQYGQSELSNLGWCRNNTDPTVMCQYDIIRFEMEQDYCTYSAVNSLIDIRYSSSLLINAYEEKFDGLPPTRYFPASATIFIARLKVTLSLQSNQVNGSLLVHVPNGQVTITMAIIDKAVSFLPTYQLDIGLGELKILNAPYYLQNNLLALKPVSFYDQPNLKGNKLDLPFGIYNSNFLGSIGWLNRIKSFSTPFTPQFKVDIFDESNQRLNILESGNNVDVVGLYSKIQVFTRMHSIQEKGVTYRVLDAKDPKYNTLPPSRKLEYEPNSYTSFIVVNNKGFCSGYSTQEKVLIPISQFKTGTSYPYSLKITSDGDVVIIDSYNTVSYSFNTTGLGARYLQVDNWCVFYLLDERGDIVYYHFDGIKSYRSGSSDPYSPPLIFSLRYLDALDPTRNTLGTNQFLTNGRDYLKIDDEGRLVLYAQPFNHPLWTSNFETNQQVIGPYQVKIEIDGNLCCYGSNSALPRWCTKSQGIGGRYFMVSQTNIMQRWGLIILNHIGNLVWGRFGPMIRNNPVYIYPLYFHPRTFLNTIATATPNHENEIIYEEGFITNGYHYLKLDSYGYLKVYKENPSLTQPLQVLNEKPSFPGPYHAKVDNTGFKIFGGNGSSSLIVISPFNSLKVPYRLLIAPTTDQYSNDNWAIYLTDQRDVIIGGFASVGDQFRYEVSKMEQHNDTTLIEIENPYVKLRLQNRAEILLEDLLLPIGNSQKFVYYHLKRPTTTPLCTGGCINNIANFNPANPQSPLTFKYCNPNSAQLCPYGNSCCDSMYVTYFSIPVEKSGYISLFPTIPGLQSLCAINNNHKLVWISEQTK